MRIEEIIINKYLNEKESVLKISKDLGLKYWKVQKILVQNKISIRSNKFNSLKFSCNQYYFENIDTINKAYWLGFIAADGHVTKRNQLFLSQTFSDSEILEKFKKDIEFNGNIKFYKPKTPTKLYGRIGITSEKIVDDLKRHGIVENKSLILEPPKNIPENLISHFIRGYFDGDGSLTQNKSGQANFKICGTSELLSWIVDVLNQNIEEYNFKLNLYKRRNDIKNSYYISFGGNSKTLSVMNFIYNNTNGAHLDRKYNRYLLLKSKQHSRSLEKSKEVQYI